MDRTWISRRDALRALAASGLGLAAGAASAAAGGVADRMPRQGRGELLIRGGRVVNAADIRDADIRIVGETIAEIGTGLSPGVGARVIEAAGRLVMPGGIDPHTHLQPNFVDDLTSGSRAALAGGITTVGTFAGTRQGETVLDALERLAGLVRTDAIADVILHATTWPPAPELTAAIPELAERGQPSCKIYMTRQDFGAHLAEVIKLLEAARDAGVVTMIHCEDGALLAAAVRRLQAAGRTTLRDYPQSRPLIAEVAATQQAAALCESTGAPMHVVHLSSRRALEACRPARAAGLPFFVETRPLYLHLTEERMTGPEAPLYVGQPPLRSQEDAEALWRGLADGSIDVLATDHAPWTREQKLDPALSITRLRPGVSNLQVMLPMYFSEGVGKRKLSLERFVETTSTNAARIFGLYPRKGVIQVGADGDVVIWDPRRTATVRGDDDWSKSDYSVYEGWEVTGWPEVTIRRGEVVCQNGQVMGRTGTGKLAAREPWRVLRSEP
ncbi:MAG TPA: amidohydrolase family protein [Gemmatimonadales bacterium]